MQRFRRTSESAFPTVDIIPLMDVLFALLLFFVVSASLMVRANVLDVRMPVVGSGPSARSDAAATVAIAADGGVFVDGKPSSLDAVAARVAGLRAGGRGVQPVYVVADASASYGSFVLVMNALRDAGFEDVRVLGAAGGSSP